MDKGDILSRVVNLERENRKLFDEAKNALFQAKSERLKSQNKEFQDQSQDIFTKSDEFLAK